MARDHAAAPACLILLSLATLGTAGCGLLSLTAPSSDAWKKSLPTWSPYVVIQPNDAALAGYRQALTSLTAHGAVWGARVGLSIDGSSGPTVSLVASFGLDVIGIVDDSDLFAPDVEGVFDRYRAAYPQVKTFQIGNEITTFSPPMPIGQYVDVFARVYAHVLDAYPNVTLVSQSTFGSGTTGSSDLAAEGAAFAAKNLRPSRLVLGVNVYSEEALAAYATVVPSLPGSYRIWVTETGVPDQTQQLTYVTVTYPRVQAALRAERIYWYALWAGDVGGDSDFSLIKNPTRTPIAPGPLFQLLTSERCTTPTEEPTIGALDLPIVGMSLS